MKIRDRIKELRRVKASDLRPSPRNWRTHPGKQREALQGVLAEIGYADALIARELPDGSLELIDGHLRAETTPDQEVPVLVLDVDEAEASKILATLDPLAALAESDAGKLDALLREVSTGSAAVQELLAGLADDAGLYQSAGGPVPVASAPPAACNWQDLAPTADELARLAGKRVCVEFSGGKDSSAAALWVKQCLPDVSADLVYVDLGADHVGFHRHLAAFAEWIGFPLHVLRSERNIIDDFLAHGKWPSFGGPYCHKLLHDALDKHVDQWPVSEVVIVRGGRAEERARQQGRKQSTRFLSLDRRPDSIYFQPLYWATKDTADRLLTEAGAPIWEGYAKGLQRTACRICPGQRTGTYAAIRKHYPDVWAELLWLEERFGPGAWQDPVTNCGRGSFVDLADRADAKGAVS